MPGRPRIRIGNQTAFSAERVALPFEFAVDHGFDAFEWFPDKKESGAGWTVRDIPAEVRSSIKATAEARDIRLSVHAPWPSDPLNGDAGQSFNESIDFAKQIGASLFIAHLRTDLGIGAYAEALRPFMPLLREAGIGLAIENTVLTSPRDMTAIFRHLSGFGEDTASRVGICLDLGHANLCRETRNDYLRFFDMLGPEVPIVHVHLHENYGDHDSHLTIFTGPAGKDSSGITVLVERLKKRNFSGSIILEQWPSPEGLLVEARNRLREIIAGEPAAKPARGNAGQEEIVAKFAEANSRLLSWRKRLEWVLNLLSGAKGRPDIDLLVSVAVYLRFIGTGAVPCGEDGGHYRPSHHARISEHLYRRLLAAETDDNRFVMRKIYPWLPAFDTEFKRAEPLTLIRDIAHRNDIPRELKQEIKTTLQNKLHRSAGPEDLAVSSALLERITAPGASYPQAFIAEFRRFHEELKDFFNAGSLKELLLRIVEKDEFGDVPLLYEFIAVLDSPGKDRDALKALEILTGIRARLVPQSLTDSGAADLRLQIADIRLEEQAFVLLSEIANEIDERKAGGEFPWEKALRASLFATANVRLGGFETQECGAIESELKAEASVFDSKRRDSLLRLKASADRCLRLAESYRDSVLALFPEKAKKLGEALGVAQQAITVYAEADIRSHPVFQLTKLVSLLLGEIRLQAVLPSRQIIVPGHATGTLLPGASLSSLPAEYAQQAVALVARATGEEEIPPYVEGIVVTTETPLLSHLAVRARQNGTVFIFCGERERLEELRGFSGKQVSIAAAGENFTVSPADSGPCAEEDRVQAKPPAVVTPAVAETEEALIAVDQITSPLGGGKAYGARRLSEVSQLSGAGFFAPGGLVIPFGVMERSLRTNSALAEEYASLAGKMDRLSPAERKEGLGRLKDLVMRIDLPGEVPEGITRHFGRDCRLMVRSSSNCEDAEELAGAGLYDSVVNVPLSGAVRAVLRVWASLWNERAADARRYAGILHGSCRMAVLIQPVLSADLSFVMHTVNPVSGAGDEILIELAAGLGETLASGRESGSPFRVVYRKKAGTVETLSFASYSFSARPAPAGGTLRERIDYSNISFAFDDDFRKTTATRIGGVGEFAARAIGRPLDIEGLLRNDEIYLVQARPQQLLHRRGRKQCRS